MSTGGKPPLLQLWLALCEARTQYSATTSWWPRFRGTRLGRALFGSGFTRKPGAAHVWARLQHAPVQVARSHEGVPVRMLSAQFRVKYLFGCSSTRSHSTHAPLRVAGQSDAAAANQLSPHARTSCLLDHSLPPLSLAGARGLLF